MEFWEKKKVLTTLKITEKHLRRMREQGAPAFVPFKGYDMVALCQWIISRPMKRADRTKIREYAQKVLKKIEGKSSEKHQEPELQTQAEKPARSSKVSIKTETDVGLLPALERARSAELAAYNAHQDFVKKSGIVSASHLDAWQKTLDILRKCEKDFAEVLERRRELVEMKEVQQFFEIMIEQTKSILLNLPAKLAPILECLPWAEIEKKLDQEIRDAITKLSNIS